MQYRELGRTGWKVSTVSFGAWAIGGSWGTVDDQRVARRAAQRAVDLGVNFIDTADVYGDGRSERLVAQLRRERPRRRSTSPPRPAGGSIRTPPRATTARTSSRSSNAASRIWPSNAIDLLQLHCPPNDVYYRPEVFGVLDDLVAAGKLRYYGVSVKSPEEGLKAMDFPNVQSVQIIFNMFRHRPAELFFARGEAAARSASWPACRWRRACSPAS